MGRAPSLPMNKLIVNQKLCMKDFFITHSYFTVRGYKKSEETRAVTSETRQQKKKIFSGARARTVRGTKSVDLAVTSEIVRCSYITRPLNFSQGQRGDRLNKITGLFAVSGRLAPTLFFPLSEVLVLGIEWFFPREGEGQEEATYLSAWRRLFITWSHQS